MGDNNITATCGGGGDNSITASEFLLLSYVYHKYIGM